ncbi:MAG: hypothetical protein WD716_10245 [Fimbriimonadaceae bacterium]
MSNTICQFLAQEARGNGRLLSYHLESTKCDMTWKPSAKASGRSMLDQADECAKLNHAIAGALRTDGTAKFTEGSLVSEPKQAAKQVMDSANDLADALGGLEDPALDKMIALPFGTYPARFAVGIANANMIYHWGQANYIETLDGDAEFRIPPEFVAR